MISKKAGWKQNQKKFNLYPKFIIQRKMPFRLYFEIIAGSWILNCNLCSVFFFTFTKSSFKPLKYKLVHSTFFITLQKK